MLLGCIADLSVTSVCCDSCLALSVVIRNRARPAGIIMDQVAVGSTAMRAIPGCEAGPITVRGHFGDQLHGGVTPSADFCHRLHASPFAPGLWGFSKWLTKINGLLFEGRRQNNFAVSAGTEAIRWCAVVKRQANTKAPITAAIRKPYDRKVPYG